MTRCILRGFLVGVVGIASILIPAAGADLHGTIRLHNTAQFELTTSRMDTTYEITTSNSNDFQLVAAAFSGGDTLKAVTRDGMTLDVSLDYHLVGPGDVLPDKEQKIRVELQAVEDIVWVPEAISRPGYTTYRYHGIFTPRTVTFDPPVVFSLMEGDSKVGTTGSVPIRELHYTGHPQISLHTGSLSLRAHRIKLELEDGFQANDDFLIATGASPIKKPQAGSGTEIAFISNADNDSSVPLELYYPTGGPHVLAFFSDLKKSIGFDCNDLRIDGVHVLRTEAHISTQVIRIPTKWYWPFDSSFRRDDVTFSASFDDPTIYMYDVRIRSDVRFLTLWENRLSKLADTEDLKQRLDKSVSEPVKRLSFPLSEYINDRAWSPLTVEQLADDSPRSTDGDRLVEQLKNNRRSVSSLTLPIIWSGTGLATSGEFAPPDGTPLGTYDGQVVLEGANLEKAFVPIRYELYDPLGSAKQTFAGVTLALFTSYLGWFLFDRRRKLRENIRGIQDAKIEFIRDHYKDCIELKERLMRKWDKPGLQWSDLDEDLQWLMQKQLQGLFSVESWTVYERYFVAQDSAGMSRFMSEEMRDISLPQSKATVT